MVHNGVPGPDILILYCCALLHDVRSCVCIYPLFVYTSCCFSVCCYPAVAAAAAACHPAVVAAAVLMLACCCCSPGLLCPPKKKAGQTRPTYHPNNPNNKDKLRIMLVLAREQSKGPIKARV